MRAHAVPRREEKDIKAEAQNRYGGDQEKVATATVPSLEVDGVLITSRYDKAHEFDCMAGMVKGVDKELRHFIESIWCDSKANACYSVVLKSCLRGQARVISDQLDRDCRRHDGGHNGIWISGANGGELVFDPCWMEDF